MADLLIFILFLCFHYAFTQAPPQPTETYANSSVISSNSKYYVLYWKLLTNNNEIQFEVVANTSGWLALGITSAGAGMTGNN